MRVPTSAGADDVGPGREVDNQGDIAAFVVVASGDAAEELWVRDTVTSQHLL